MKFDYYEKLEVPPDALEEQIKESYRVLAKMYHPDNHINSTDKVKQMASKKFSDIRVAYKTLSDENLRFKYDKRRLSGQREDDYYDDEYDDGSEYEPREYTQAEHEEQLSDAILAFRRGIPKVVKAAAVFVGVLGWIMFISYAFGNWGGNNDEGLTNMDFVVGLIMEENIELERQLDLYREQSRNQRGIIANLGAELASARYLNIQLSNALQHDDVSGELNQEIGDLRIDLFTAQFRLDMLEDEIKRFIEMALDIQWVLRQMLEAMPGPPDDLFNELWFRHVELLDNLQRLGANLAVGGVD